MCLTSIMWTRNNSTIITWTITHKSILHTFFTFSMPFSMSYHFFTS
ncbi:unnamed protein product [Schistosoma mattheei]|uniref:Uncharacterized protein n=1 Tax=Schistosoma mattheei TaxID=31246 RepID=A0A183P6A0_9TREM|nr:unnamed protein product [Schistosoma mattheei]